jgi:hypothetical protein
MVVKKKGATSGGKMKMVMKGGKMVPAFAADGVGKMRQTVVRLECTVCPMAK